MDPRIASSPRDSVFHLLRVVLQEHGTRWAERLTEPGVRDVTKPQYAILRAVAANPGLDQAAAGQFTGTDKATVTAMLDRLQRRGLLTRDVHPDDRRRRQLHLTPRGEELLAAMTPTVDHLNEELLSRLSDVERGQLTALLTKLAGQPT
ncbi:MAG: MarR family transcriptional regulator, temperature-dependent positive regulator of motility [Pseudonocardiales bacterium]|jgi:DNA-binding MarR family transcriptional regulator|uniref:MarR family winged helix-turn-helix transcriptional regulator n=1 Tax=Pseudonocardia sp. Cha107L01 TaxID=3457576 RepID=UPI0028CB0618|nr:MarR family transcriptional regulator, temperature-dependent positive regulator of motility [Pseudonocardiales bacterium]MDT7568815.1 MarR family transcriptional regulator, temperature-dependent positive regulator of motility [Pseudonocardiales bacterium]MDT7582958.1 MarR family transcriptional regulator, temperature-dependent positive regulator of motility [Pseudonocardiales bacterium]MDT7608108.1 MarR family transcriptional regulator, temperature-dependent positive regulator of motility [Ps